jgi:hypothetical protein
MQQQISLPQSWTLLNPAAVRNPIMQNEIDNEVETECSALLVNPITRTVTPIQVAGYASIRAAFDGARIEAGTMSRLDGKILIHAWGRVCDDFLETPGWYSQLNPRMPLHGLSVIDASDISTGESVDCPVTPEEFAGSIVWEDSKSRIDPADPK